MSVKTLGRTARDLVALVRSAQSMRELAEVIFSVTVRYKKSLTRGEVGALLDLGAKKEKLLLAQGR